jgi:hypothetical protein
MLYTVLAIYKNIDVGFLYISMHCIFTYKNQQYSVNRTICISSSIPTKIRRVNTHCNYKDNSIKVNAEFYSNENQEALPDFTNERLIDEAELSTVTNTVRNNGRSDRAS